MIAGLRTRIEPSRRRRPVRWAIVGVVPLLAAVSFAGCDDTEAVESEPSDIAPAVARDIRVMVEATGYVEPIRIVEVKSKASGEVLAMHVDVGDEVERGALMAEVDPRDVRNQFAQAEAELDVARASLGIATSQLARQKELQEANVVTQQEYETAALNEANARSQLVRAEVDLELAQEQRGDVTIQAPINGTVIQRDVEAGQIITSATGSVSEGTTLLLMADLSEIQVRMLVDETDLGRVQPGQLARVRVDAYPDRPLTGEITKIEPQAVEDESVIMFPVLIHLENRERLLRPGMTTQIEVDVANRQDVVAVPNQAIVGTDDVIEVASLLGVDEEAVQLAMRTPPGGATAGADGDAANGQGVGAVDEDCQALVQRMRGSGGGGSGGSGGSGSPGRGFADLSDEDREQMLECREQFQGARATAGEGRRFGGSEGAPGSGVGPQAATGEEEDEADDLRARSVSYDEPRSSILFLAGPDGPEPRSVTLGVNDWDYTEVLEGLEVGEQVILISVARLQAQQDDMMDRFRERSQIFPSTNDR